MRTMRLSMLGPLMLGVALVTASAPSAAPQSSTAGAGGDTRIAAGDRAAIIEAALSRLTAQYVSPDVAAKMVAAVRAHQQAGRYDEIDGAVAFAQALTTDLRAVSQDRHLQVVFRPARPGNPPRPPQAVVTAEVLEGNVGYLRLGGFPPRDRISGEIDAAMTRLTQTDALLVDIRENRGGDPRSAMHVAGYLFEKPTLVARIYSRPDDTTTEMWTEQVKGPKYLAKPVYILTSRTTFSAAEALAYHLTHLGRAKTVGETTGGGAHRVQPADLGRGFTLQVPFTRPANVVSKGNWEGVGVPPALPAAAADAQRVAHIDALSALPETDVRRNVLARLKQASQK